jgi:tetratricopeptide (TPR) repeat protein
MTLVRVRVTLLVLLAVLVSAPSLWPQSAVDGAIGGSVTDIIGAFVARASILVRNLAERWFKEAVRLDPNFVLGYVGLQEAYGVAAGIGGVQPKPALLLAEEAARRALQLGPDLAESHVAIAYVQLNLHRNLPAAIAEAKRAIELDPNLAKAHVAYAGFLNAESRHLQAVDEVQKAMALDPEWLHPKVVYAFSLQAAGRFQQAEAFARTLPYPQGARIIAITLIRQGKADQALRELQEASKRGPVYDYNFLLEWGNAQIGRPELLRAGAARAVENRRTRYFSATNIASLYSLLGDRVNTLRWLNTAFDEYDPLLYQFGGLQGVPEFLRDDPEYRELRRKMFTPE